MGRIVINTAGAARRPAQRGRLALIVLGCAIAYAIGYVSYVVVTHTTGGK